MDGDIPVDRKKGNFLYKNVYKECDIPILWGFRCQVSGFSRRIRTKGHIGGTGRNFMEGVKNCPCPLAENWVEKQNIL
jgi:hypothetical protein